MRTLSAYGKTLAGLGMLFFLVAKSNASLILVLDDLETPGTEVVVVDNVDGAVSATTASVFGIPTHGDGHAEDGVVLFNGSVGSFMVNVTTGLSSPVIGPYSLHLNSVNVSGGTGRLRIMLTDTDYALSGPTHANFDIGGTTNGTISAAGYIDSSSAEFGLNAQIGSTFDATTGGAFSASFSDVAMLYGDFSLTSDITISHSSAGQVTSFDAEIRVGVPEPSSIGLMGIGLAGVGLARRRKVAVRKEVNRTT